MSLQAHDVPEIDVERTVDAGRPRALMIGPMPRVGTPIGGTQVSFEQCVRRMRAGGAWDVEVVDTSRIVHGASRLSLMARNAQILGNVLSAVARRARGSDVVVLNMSSGALLQAGPLVSEMTHVLGTPLVVRAFGGCLDETYDDLPAWRQHWIDHTLFRAPLVLLQTHALCARFAHVDGVRWFPTTRDCPPTFTPPSPRCRRFLFLSQIREEKGILEAVEAARRLPEHCSLTVRGPAMPGFDTSVFEGHPRITYGGPVAPHEVPQVLAEHDALLFPTWYEGEGIPGVVIESLQAGRAVIASSWRTLPEVVQDGVSGLLVPPRDVDALSDAMNRLTIGPGLHARLSRGARARGLEFDATGWHRRFEHWLRQVADDELPSRVAGPLPDPQATHTPNPTTHRAPTAAPIEEHVA